MSSSPEETLQLEIGKTFMDYQTSFVEETQREERYNREMEALDAAYEEDHDKILEKRARSIDRLAHLMELATQTVEGKDIILAKLQAEAPQKKTFYDAKALLNQIRTRASLKKKYDYDPAADCWDEDEEEE